MRALLGLLVLGGLFLMAASWQGRTTAKLRQQRTHELGTVTTREEVLATRAGWSRLVLGRPSGAAPLDRPPPADDPISDSPPGGPRGGSGPAAPPRYARDFEYEVQSGDVLSLICQGYYGRGKLREIVPAVARYNDLASEDDIVAGDVLRLPDVTLLLGN